MRISGYAPTQEETKAPDDSQPDRLASGLEPTQRLSEVRCPGLDVTELVFLTSVRSVGLAYSLPDGHLAQLNFAFGGCRLGLEPYGLPVIGISGSARMCTKEHLARYATENEPTCSTTSTDSGNRDAWWNVCGRGNDIPSSFDVAVVDRRTAIAVLAPPPSQDVARLV